MLTFQILTKDSVTIFVNAIMYYRVKVGHIKPERKSEETFLFHFLCGRGPRLARP